MTSHAVTLHLPEPLYKRLQKRAEMSQRSLETEILDAVASAASVEDELPPEPDEGAHIFAVMNEEVYISGRPMAQIDASERGTATQVAGDPLLAGTHEVEDRAWNDSAIKGLTHDSRGSGLAAAIPAAATPAARPTSAANGPDNGSIEATARESRSE